ncbi:GmrSD restriction endonuclease domain-containing protein [Botrimarina mediterranea]|uniref:GmrSD restriction endonuclease domain-containing protein n=1 Tax=Botrimarina mediterranea TaxID=2528022 RepID=UPI00118B6DEB|nr:hypothetical protein K2D_46830 [Planctomycetes bacterium K2D]
MGKAEASVEELVQTIERGELRLPEMQRRYVWKAPRVRDLLDSLYRGYPSGAILIWETDEAVPTRDFAVGQSGNPYQTTKLLLDGQQRLTSLSAVVRGEPIAVRGRKRPLELLFNLEHPDLLTYVNEVDEESESGEEEVEDASEDELQKRFDQLTFVVATKKLASQPQWIKVTDVFKSDSDASFLKEAGVTDFDDPRYEKYTNRLKRLRNIKKYIYRMDILERNLSYEEVTEIFVRVNSLGTKLRSSDLAMAQITAKWHESLKTFETFQDECADQGFDVDLGIHLKNLIVFATGQSRFKTVGSLSVEKLQESWEVCKEGFHFAINFLKSNAGIESPALLSSPFLMNSLAYYGHYKNYSLSPQEEADLRYWLYVANTKGRYSRGSSETLLDQDLTRIRDGRGVEGMIESLKSQFGRLDITPGELEGRNARSAYFKTLFLAFRKDGAKDWTSNLNISLSHSGKQHALQFHHIFPKALLKGQYRPVVVNDIANLAFIGGKTNRRISNKAPEKYFPEIIEKQGKGVLAAQCIPSDNGVLSTERFTDFLSARRSLIADRLNCFLKDARTIQ